MKMQNALKARESLKKLSELDLSISVAYKIYKLCTRLDHYYTFYESKRREIIGKYCTLAEDEYKVKEECTDDFERSFDELMNIELEIDGVELPVALPAYENIKLSCSDLVSLDGFVEIGG